MDPSPKGYDRTYEALLQTLKDCHMCFEGMIYDNKPCDGPIGECPNCYSAIETIAFAALLALADGETP